MSQKEFRAYDNLNKKWLHSYKTLGGCNILGETILLGGWMHSVRLENLKYVVVEQFTGLYDKNNTKIFEGDYFLINDKKFIVEYVDDQASYVLTTGLGYDTPNCIDLNCDVVYGKCVAGNVHED
jgi:hypothetical protein